MSEDAELLRRYLEDRSQTAFGELVQRHINLVYSVALRQVGGDSHLAEDVAQQVFTALARKAGSLASRPTLSGWLYRSAHFAASDVVRVERRRRTREQEAHIMEPQNSPGAAVDPGTDEIEWAKLRPTIDAAIAELGERDRDAVSLRFFDGRSFADVGQRLRLSENAARMRVDRALDKLHAALSRRGITSTAAAIGIALGSQAAIQVPAGLATAISGAAVAGSAIGATGVIALLTSSKIMTGIGAGVTAAAIGVAVVQHQEAREAAVALASVERQRLALQAELTNANRRIAEADQRTADAERDSGELLAAVQRARQAAATDRGAFRRLDADASGQSAAEEERLVVERAYQQKLAQRRVEEAKARAKIDSEVAAEKDPLVGYSA